MAPARRSIVFNSPVEEQPGKPTTSVPDDNDSSGRLLLDEQEESVWRTARPWWVFSSKVRVLTLFFLIDFLIYLDRGIVPGSHDEFTRFLMQSALVRRHPEVFFGMLQSVFIGGLAVAAPILSFLGARTQRPIFFLAFGLTIWLISIAGCGAAGLINSVSVLFIARALSGVGEGAFIGLMAPILLDGSSTERRGIILGIFYGLMPVGSAVGFILSAAIVEWVSWAYGFLLLALLATPPILCMCIFATTKASYGLSPLHHFAADEAEHQTHQLLLLSAGDAMSSGQTSTDCPPHQTAAQQHSSANTESEIDETNTTAHTPPTHNERHYRLDDAPPSPPTPPAAAEPAALRILPTSNETLVDIHNESSLSFRQCLSCLACSPMFPNLLVSGAAQAAVAAGLISFGTAFLLNLGLFQSELHASTAIGIAGALAGSIGTLAGGYLLLLPQRWASNNNMEAHDLVQREGASWMGETQEEEKLRYNTVSNITFFTAVLAAFAATLLSVAPLLLFWNFDKFVPGAMICVAIGLILIFMTQSGLNLSVMLCAPQRYRFLSVSVFTLGLHLLGDVPGPIFVGYLKDLLAPECSPGEEAASITVNEGCRAERNKLLLTLFIFLSWAHFIWVGMSICSHKAKKQLRSSPDLPLFRVPTSPNIATAQSG